MRFSVSEITVHNPELAFARVFSNERVTLNGSRIPPVGADVRKFSPVPADQAPVLVGVTIASASRLSISRRGMALVSDADARRAQS
jgi:hypothetical protein